MTPLHLRDGVIWLDGRRVPWPEATLYVLSHGLHYGTAAFEGVRVYGGRPFKLREHCERLAFSCRTVGIALPFDVDRLVAEIEAYARACRFDDAYLRPIAWRGADELGIVGRSTDCRLAVAGWDWSGPHPGAAEAGLSLGIGPWRRPAPTMWPLQAKLSGLYAIGSMNVAAVRAHGFDDALVLAPDGTHVAELSGANIVFVRDGTLVTPPTDHALDGLTRQEIVSLAAALSILVEVADVALSDIAAFDGAFATGTAYEVVPVARIGDHRFDLGTGGLRRVLDPLRQAYRERTRGG
ncbi:branched-chain amino acid aminotransferase [Methylobacterium sp. ap11]|uniref:aminotransferase class IV n=1 Tax=Methylobacterium sp. ap11 TaxID=1761799 RepID=UPI0008B1EBCF|nr:aminotransferase class IV [Methylobacterium sp. ap11]SEO37404.1 branched-chain amino acid aminotransferase [Methylobacterium sp. ap11]